MLSIIQDVESLKPTLGVKTDKAVKYDIAEVCKSHGVDKLPKEITTTCYNTLKGLGYQVSMSYSNDTITVTLNW